MTPARQPNLPESSPGRRPPAPQRGPSQERSPLASSEVGGGPPIARVGPVALHDMLASDRPPLLLDVRSWEQRSIARFPGDRWMPLRELAERLVDLPRGPLIVVYCHHGGSALRAADLLRASGLENVAVLEGGIDEYARVVDPTIPRYGDDAARSLVLQQFPNLATGCLAYLVHDRSSREALLLDPGKDVAPYLHALTAQRLRLRAIVETHTHADHLSGHGAIHQRTGAAIHLSRRSPAQYPHEILADGQGLKLGSSELVVLETPGHTVDHVSLLSGDAVFTGDTLLPGSCGRTDLGSGDPTRLWESLTTKILTLPEGTEVFPAHYGHLHGLPPPERYSTTIGYERETNEALAQPTREAFLAYMADGWPPKPPGFERIVEANLHG